MRASPHAIIQSLWAAFRPFRLRLDLTRELIARAIRERKVIILRYADGSLRSVCPHAMGLGKDGRRRVLAYQFDGETGEGWRDLILSRIVEVVRLRNWRWRSAGNYAGGGKSIRTLEVAI